jgi:hypothetical protein
VQYKDVTAEEYGIRLFPIFSISVYNHRVISWQDKPDHEDLGIIPYGLVPQGYTTGERPAVEVPES